MTQGIIQKQIEYLKSKGFVKTGDFELSLELTYTLNKDSLVYGHLVVKYDQDHNTLGYPYFRAEGKLIYSEYTLNTIITKLHLLQNDLDLIELGH